MLSEQFIKDLLKHKGPIFAVRERISAGSDFDCPRCKATGKCESMQSDDKYSQWVELVPCRTCGGTKRVSKTHEVFTNYHWSITFNADGMNLSDDLKCLQPFHLKREPAEQEKVQLDAKLARQLEERRSATKQPRKLPKNWR